MKDLLHYILERLVTYPENIVINEKADQYGNTLIEASVNPEDMGKVIGKNGKIIASIRKLLKVKALKTNTHFQLTLIDPLQKD